MDDNGCTVDAIGSHQIGDGERAAASEVRYALILSGRLRCNWRSRVMRHDQMIQLWQRSSLGTELSTLFAKARMAAPTDLMLWAGFDALL